MFTLRVHTLAAPYIAPVSQHRTLKAAKAAKASAEKRNPPGRYGAPLATHRYQIVKPTTLRFGNGRYTIAFYLIVAAGSRDGIGVTNRAGNFSNFSDLMDLTREGLLETRYNGPKGGRTWHVTSKGRRAVATARKAVAA